MTAPIDGPRPAKHEEAAKLKPLTRLLGEVQQRFVERCKKLIERSFLEADDQLHELSIGGKQVHGANTSELMEELSDVKASITDAFAASLAQSFHRLVQPEAFNDIPFGAGLAHAKLTVVEGEGFELDKALKELAPKVRAHYAEALDAFIKRLDHLLLQVEVSPANNPVEPFLIIQSFLRACSSQPRMSKRLKVLLFAQFRAHVLKKLGSCYLDLNNVLLEAGILPEPEKGAELLEAPSKDPLPELDKINLEVLVPVQEIPDPVPAPRPAPALARSLAARNNPPAADVAYRPRNLNRVTGRSPVRRPVDPPAHAAHKSAPAKSPGDASRPKLALSSRSNLSRDEVLALCSGVFREIQADALVPELAKERICQLQLPYTQFALAGNADFLLQPEHPARCLLELLWDFGRSLVNAEFVELQPKYVRMVDVISEIRNRHSVSEENFLQAYCKLLALQ